jgi:hypothetical protein
VLGAVFPPDLGPTPVEGIEILKPCRCSGGVQPRELVGRRRHPVGHGRLVRAAGCGAVSSIVATRGAGANGRSPWHRRCVVAMGALSRVLAAEPGAAAGIGIAGSSLLLAGSALLALWIRVIVDRHVDSGKQPSPV